MWTVVYIASTKKEADILIEDLTKAGFLVKVKSTEDGFEVRAPETEADSVYRSIINNLR